MTKRVPGHGTKRYFVREDPDPAAVARFIVVFRDDDSEVERYDNPDTAAKRATFLIRRRQNAGQKPVARLESRTSTLSVYIVGTQRVSIMTVGGRVSYNCTCSSLSGSMGCKHIDASKECQK